MKSGIRLINIDETWLNEMDFRRRCWSFSKQDSSMVQRMNQPRISVIAAIDNFGEVYLSLTQVNTNSEVMGLYLRLLRLSDPGSLTCRGAASVKHLAPDLLPQHGQGRPGLEGQIPIALPSATPLLELVIDGVLNTCARELIERGA